ncbi:M56 family metallopeptidase [Kitasatospora aureofaciens]|uniref:M56 family metallopeptidase n=1 Tax=Kitasatospora aureofaciens TaxID=1894 RepID=UPI0005259A37|nr:M56 family metallopeptidase [Kitasatospora aureofaciens]HJD85705.1 M56 family metallopeptidase [Kitasatospora aureofaciens]
MLAVWVPLLLPFLAVPLARRLAEALPPRAAAWLLAGTATVLAGGTLCSLGLLATAGLLQLPPVAALGHLSLPWLTAAAPSAPVAAALAGPVLAVLAVLAVRTARRRHLELRAARAALPAAPARPALSALPAHGTDPADERTGPHPAHRPAGVQHADTRPLRASVRRARATRWLRSSLPLLRQPVGHQLAVLDDERADAFALPGRLRRPGRMGEPGRIVVTSGMLRALSGPERAALLAHERAHLTGRHHVFLALAEHAADLHPALRPLRAPLGYHLERWADEVAAARVGDRAVTARAVGRAALAASRSPWPDRPRLVAAAHAGPVPRRVAALLQPRPSTTPATRLRAVALALAACLALTTAATLEATADLHRTVEAAQHEPGAPR